jgi:hypothetical protein
VQLEQWLLLEKRASQLLIHELFAYISVNYGETFSASVRTNPMPKGEDYRGLCKKNDFLAGL